MRFAFQRRAACCATGLAALTSVAGAQSPMAHLRLRADDGIPFGETFTVTVSLDYEGLPPDSLGLSGWNFGIEWAQGLTFVSATYLTPAGPLVDQSEPFISGYDFEVSERSIEFNEGLNPFDLNSPAEFHTGGVLAEITFDATFYTGSTLPGNYLLISRFGNSPFNAFTYAAPPAFPFLTFTPTDFNAATYGGLPIPGPGSVAVLAIGGGLAGRRRRQGDV